MSANAFTMRTDLDRLQELQVRNELVIFLREVARQKKLIQRAYFSHTSLPPEVERRQVFFSYAWEKKDDSHFKQLENFLNGLAEDFECAGVVAWHDLKRLAGCIEDEMRKGINESQTILLMGTKTYAQKTGQSSSTNVRKELDFSLSKYQSNKSSLLIIPLVLEGDPTNTFPASLGNAYLRVQDLDQWLDLEAPFTIDNQNHIRNIQGYIEFFTSYNPIGLLPLVLGIKDPLDNYYKELRESYIKAQESLISRIKAIYDNRSRVHLFQTPVADANFVERKDLYDYITTCFSKFAQQSHLLMLYGLGGTGKTKIAEHYYLYSLESYTLRAWFNTESKDVLQSQYIELAKRNQNEISLKDTMSIEEKAKCVKEWLERRGSCLLVYDNFDSSDDITIKAIDNLLPKIGRNHILITSRNSQLLYPKKEVGAMGRDEAILLVSKMISKDGYELEINKKDADLSELVVNKLGCLPLALAQAGAYMAITPCSIVQYEELYTSYQPAILSKDILGAHKPVWATFDINLRELEKYPNTLEILERVCWLNPSFIPEILLEGLIAQRKDIQKKPLVWSEIKKQLKQYSLMQIETIEHRLSMHILLQDILRYQQKNQPSSSSKLNNILLEFVHFFDNFVGFSTGEECHLHGFLLSIESIIENAERNQLEPLCILKLKYYKCLLQKGYGLTKEATADLEKISQKIDKKLQELNQGNNQDSKDLRNEYIALKTKIYCWLSHINILYEKKIERPEECLRLAQEENKRLDDVCLQKTSINAFILAENARIACVKNINVDVDQYCSQAKDVLTPGEDSDVNKYRIFSILEQTLVIRLMNEGKFVEAKNANERYKQNLDTVENNLKKMYDNASYGKKPGTYLVRYHIDSAKIALCLDEYENAEHSIKEALRLSSGVTVRKIEATLYYVFILAFKALAPNNISEKEGKLKEAVQLINSDLLENASQMSQAIKWNFKKAIEYFKERTTQWTDKDMLSFFIYTVHFVYNWKKGADNWDTKYFKILLDKWNNKNGNSFTTSLYESFWIWNEMAQLKLKMDFDQYKQEIYCPNWVKRVAKGALVTAAPTAAAVLLGYRYCCKD